MVKEKFYKGKFSRFFSKIIISLMAIIITNCSNITDNNRIIDPKLQMTYNQIYEKSHNQEENLKKINEDMKENISPILPNIAEILELPQNLIQNKEKSVSLSITEDVDLKDVLIEISRLADLELELDPEITGGIILRVKDKPLSQVIERISRLAQLRYNYQDGVLKIERDKPYIKSYPLDFLNNTRSINSKSNINTSLVKNANDSNNSGTYSSIANSYDGDLWKSVYNDIKQIISLTGKNFDDMPHIKPVNLDEKNNPKIENNETNNENSFKDQYISINKQASVISIYATDSQHKKIQHYLKQVKDSVSSQVLIEAKIVEINLKDEFRSGINWNKLENLIGSKIPFNSNFPMPNSNSMIEAGEGLFEMGRYMKGATGNIIDNATRNLNVSNLDSLVQLTELFGTSRTISSPRLTAMNNQQAILSFVTNQVYFTLKVDNNTTNTSGVTNNNSTIDSTPNTVPIGMILTLQPSINSLTNEITMSIKPTISSTSNNIQDPSVAYALQNSGSKIPVSSSIPIVEIKELDSLLKIKSGKVMIIGGLMQEVANNEEIGLPGAKSIPVIGNLFKSTRKSTKIIQTVIFIKATIISNDYVTKEDRRFYDNFGRKFDHTPLF